MSLDTNLCSEQRCICPVLGGQHVHFIGRNCDWMTTPSMLCHNNTNTITCGLSLIALAAVRGCRYYIDLLFLCLKEERSYDRIPNFTVSPTST